MIEIGIVNDSGITIRAYHTPLSASKSWLMVVLPVATKAPFISLAIAEFQKIYNVVVWEDIVLRTEKVNLAGGKALSIKSSISDFKLILEHFKIQKTFLVGYCSGASLALCLAKSSQNVVARMALISGAYFLEESECQITQYEKDMLTIVPQIAASEVHASYICKGFSKKREANNEFSQDVYLPYANPYTLRQFGVAVNNYINHDFAEIASTIKTPTILIASKSDDKTSFHSSVLIHSKINQAEIYLDDLGDHYSFCRAKPSIINRVLEFFSSHKRGLTRLLASDFLY